MGWAVMECRCGVGSDGVGVGWAVMECGIKCLHWLLLYPMTVFGSTLLVLLWLLGFWHGLSTTHLTSS